MMNGSVSVDKKVDSSTAFKRVHPPPPPTHTFQLLHKRTWINRVFYARVSTFVCYTSSSATLLVADGIWIDVKKIVVFVIHAHCYTLSVLRGSHKSHPQNFATILKKVINLIIVTKGIDGVGL